VVDSQFTEDAGVADFSGNSGGFYVSVVTGCLDRSGCRPVQACAFVNAQYLTKNTTGAEIASVALVGQKDLRGRVPRAVTADRGYREAARETGYLSRSAWFVIKKRSL
jgi:hypothetical protein